MSAYPIITNRPRIVQLEEIRRETPNIKSLIFRDDACSRASPGQFIMVWIPGIDEIPMGLSTMDSSGLSAITVKRVGEASGALHNLKEGDIMGVRGPYGNGFKLVAGDLMIVGGGIGVAPLAPLAERLANAPNRVTFIIGAATRHELLFLDRVSLALSKVGGRVMVTTEDGSYGFKGLATDLADQTFNETKITMIYTCGREEMIKKMFQLAERHKTPLQTSLERIIKCSVGLCGSCTIGKYRVCRDGPVFSKEQLREVKDELGVFARDHCGKRVGFPG
ncbi:MAG: dihydroorotate dehydrogenase electron transfer subunit [Candidatus Bathyarchaeia archaeon]